ncbi:Mu transposase C-terminal domain-containing protein [Deinococcus pimensis]|uniref:Mu transposase C-terminal domain-containing protein n=1 Tax=Deinococcus pimensis TaxID=309888 RepID=UPI0004B05217|nr:DDE-type integrase/transposase/recombinase [Deinococcus pimensis]
MKLLATPARKGALVREVSTGLLFTLAGRVQDDGTVFGRPHGSGHPNTSTKPLRIANLAHPDAQPAQDRRVRRDLASIPEREWKARVEPKVTLALAVQRAVDADGSRAAVTAVAREFGVSVATAYRTLKAYLDAGAGVFARVDRPDKGVTRLDEVTEQIVAYALDTKLLGRKDAPRPDVLTPDGVTRAAQTARARRQAELDAQTEKKTKKVKKAGVTPTSLARSRARQAETARTLFADLYHLVRALCEEVGCPVPCDKTVRARVADLDEVELIMARGGRKAAHARRGTRGKHEVLEVNDEWEMDHTRLDLIIVHRRTRKPIGRAWLTVVIDVRSRVIVGWSVSLEAPSALTVTLALARAILPKDGLVAEYGFRHPFQVWGVPVTLHVDNAREFRGRTLALFASLLGFRLKFRPSGRPHFGGHVERVVGTLMGRVKGVPGATLSSVHEKGEYDAEGNAVLDFDGADRFVAKLIDEYNNTVHSRIHTTPLDRYRRDVGGDDGLSGPGMQDRFEGEAAELLRLHALPHTTVTVQREGVVWDYLRYWDDALRPRVLDGTRYILRRDPRDVSRAYLWLPDEERYLELGYRDTALPAVTLWEYRAALAADKQAGHHAVDTRRVMDSVLDRQEIVDAAIDAKKTAARAEERRVRAERGARKGDPRRDRAAKPAATPNLFDGLADDAHALTDEVTA